LVLYSMPINPNEAEDKNMPHLLKKDLRRDFMNRRLDLGETGRAEAGRLICQRVLSLAPYTRATDIAVYWPLAEEIDIRPVIDDIISSGRRAYLPRVVKDTGELEFCPFNGDPKTLAPGPFDLREPRTEPTPPETLEMVIVPGLAFDLHGHRLGYGLGYYDRFLADATAFRLGVAFDVATIDILPITDYDVAMNIVVTETRVI
jgi:5-formyltetrahydrofolate cyclo-ligase